MSRSLPRSRPATQIGDQGVPRVLLIEGLAPGRRTVREVLAGAQDILSVEHVTTLQEGLARLGTETMSAVLLDLTLPEARSLAVVDELRRVAPNVAIMLLALIRVRHRWGTRHERPVAPGSRPPPAETPG